MPLYIRNSFESLFLAVCLMPIPMGLAFTTAMIEAGNLYLILGLFSLCICASSLFVLASSLLVLETI